MAAAPHLTTTLINLYRDENKNNTREIDRITFVPPCDPEVTVHFLQVQTIHTNRHDQSLRNVFFTVELQQPGYATQEYTFNLENQHGPFMFDQIHKFAREVNQVCGEAARWYLTTYPM